MFNETTNVMGQGYIYRKGFAYGKIVADVIQEVYHSHNFERIRQKWDLDFYPACQSSGVTASEFKWHHFSGVMVIIGLVTVAGIVLNVSEHVFVYFFTKKIQSNKDKRQISIATLVSANSTLVGYMDKG